jgi:DNA invertase Pin-like site-specific DNA recombinase
MNLDNILKTILLIGSDLPAYKALFDQVLGAFSENEQEILKQTYAEAIAAADKAHAAAQAL